MKPDQGSILPKAIAPRSHARARKALLDLWERKGTWRAVGRELGFNQGYVNRVARGKRRPSRRLMCALGVRKTAPPRRLIWQRYGTFSTGMILYLLHVAWCREQAKR